MQLRQGAFFALAAVLLFAHCTATDTDAESNPIGPPKEDPPEDLPELQTPTKGPEGRGLEFAAQDYFWFNDVDGASQWEDPYSSLTDDDGNEYFVDPVTNATTWERPESAGWVAEYSNDKQQHYYVNEVTNVSTWVVPKSYAWRQVYVNEANEVVETSEEVDWDPEELEEGDEHDPEDDDDLTPEQIAELEASFASDQIDADAAEEPHQEL